MISALRDLYKPKTVGAAATPAHLHDHHGHAHHDHGHDHKHDHDTRITIMRTLMPTTHGHDHKHDHPPTHHGRIMIMAMGTATPMITIITTTPPPGATRTRRSRRSWRARADGSAA